MGKLTQSQKRHTMESCVSFGEECENFVLQHVKVFVLFLK